MGTLDGQVAMVTGAARGIGRAVAAKLAEHGALVVATDLQEEWLAETVAAVTAAGGAAEAVAFNVADPDGAAAAVQGVVERHGRLDILVNNAGITKDGLFVRMSGDDWQKVLDVNLSGVMRVTQPAAKVMMKQRSGRIVNISSVVGLMGNAGQTNYAASKAGLIGLTKSLARELGSRNVTVNAIAPGYIRTAMTEKLTDAQREALLKNVAIQRLGTPDDIAEAVLFLASPGAAYITGTVINVSGGLYM